MHQIFDIVKDKTLQHTKLYRTKIESLQNEVTRSKSKVAELQSHFDESVIPQLLEKQKEASAKHKKILQQRMNEIEELKAHLISANTNLRTLTSENGQLKSAITALEQQHEDDDHQFNEIQEERMKDKQTIAKQNDDILALTQQIEQLKLDHNRAKANFTQAQEELTRVKQNHEEKEQEIQQITLQLKKLNDQIPKEKEAAKLANQELAFIKSQNESLNKELDLIKVSNRELDNKVREIQPKLDQASAELNTVKNKLKKAKEENEQKSKEISETNDNLYKVKAELSSLQFISKNKEDENSKLQNEKKNLQFHIEELENKIKNENQANEKLKKELNEEKMNSSRQSTKIESLSNAKESLQSELDNMNQQNSKYENEIRRIKESLQNFENENKKLIESKQQLQQKISNDSEEVEQLNKKIKDLSRQLKEVTVRAEEENAFSNEQKRLNLNLKGKIEELEETLHNLQSVKERNEKTIIKNEDNIRELEAKIESMVNQNKNYSENLKRQQDANNLNEREINTLQKANNEMQEVINAIRASMPNIRSIDDIPREINRLKNLANMGECISKAMGYTNGINDEDIDHILANIEEMKKNNKTMKKIQSIIEAKNHDDLLKQIQTLKEENERLKAEYRRISSLISSDANIDISKTIEEIIDKQNQLSNDLSQAADFISSLLNIITGPSSNPTRLAFPLKKSIESRLIDLVTRIKKRADSDRDQIDKALEKARSYGYDGESVTEAAEFIVAREAESERQQTLSMIGRELGDVRNLSNSEKQSYIKKNEELKKKIVKLREALSQQMEKTRKSEEELLDEIDTLQREIRQLKSDLETERKVREEITRLGAGLSSDTSYLRSKLSQKELRLVDFAEKMSKSEKQAKMLHDQQKTMRVTLENHMITKTSSSSRSDS
ncbi:hypothetical protein TRFO_11336 [Tritrichomonas foetus]|uniref:Uncharacterized protein n=1 Tax=Tritrichomonas foetus TaxID=1144522 RepID=A0A1J4JA03_9EUKA|nr:hypothetical protein TRFO_11336 [Tritrichomonas foetus]|eukprot:OHS94084.1 hypothetical protein TRFO_11336 [Tritrichomonas foetus]